MKKLLVTTALLAGLAATVYGQGIVIKNTANSNPSSSATIGGLVWTNNGGNIGLWDGVNNNLGITVLVGATSSSLSPLTTILPNLASSPVGYTGDSAGYFAPVPPLTDTYSSGLGAGNAVWIQLQVWQWEWSSV
jgi:hypothetical protein